MSLGSAVMAQLDALARGLRARSSPARYEAADFIRDPSAPKSARRFVNQRTGESVSRRQRETLIGRPLPTGTLHASRAHVAKAARARGLVVTQLTAIVRTASGRDRRDERERATSRDIPIDPETIEPVIDAWEHRDAEAAGDAFNAAFFGAWWGAPGAAEIAGEPERLAIELGT